MKEQVPGIRCQVPGNGHPGKFPYGLGGSARIGDQTRNVYENKEEQALGLRCHVAGEKAGVRSLHNAAIGTIILASDFQHLISDTKNAGASGDMYENKGEGKNRCQVSGHSPACDCPWFRIAVAFRRGRVYVAAGKGEENWSSTPGGMIHD